MAKDARLRRTSETSLKISCGNMSGLMNHANMRSYLTLQGHGSQPCLRNVCVFQLLSVCQLCLSTFSKERVPGKFQHLCTRDGRTKRTPPLPARPTTSCRPYCCECCKVLIVGGVVEDPFWKGKHAAHPYDIVLRPRFSDQMLVTCLWQNQAIHGRRGLEAGNGAHATSRVGIPRTFDFTFRPAAFAAHL